jgi:hypothetical protein
VGNYHYWEDYYWESDYFLDTSLHYEGYRLSEDDWWIDDKTIQIFIIADSILTKQPKASSELALSQMHLLHDDPRSTLEKLPIELTAKIFALMGFRDRIQLAVCNKNLARIANNNRLLQLTEDHKHDICDEGEWFDVLDNYVDFNGKDFQCWYAEPWWPKKARAEIERQGGIFTMGIMLAVDEWWVRPKGDADHGYDGCHRSKWIGYLGDKDPWNTQEGEDDYGNGYVWDDENRDLLELSESG